MIIKVNTSASKVVSPDFMKITISLKSLNMNKDEAINTVLNNFNMMKDYFIENKIDKNLKTSSYEIKESTRREYYKEIEDGFEVKKYKDVFIGFLVTQIIEISIPINVLFATKLIALKSKENEIYVNVNYFLKNSKDFQDEVIKDALNRAREKALVIANTFDKTDVNCKIVDYTYNSYSEYSNSVVRMDKCMIMRENNIESIAETLEPTDITLTENVHTEWEI